MFLAHETSNISKKGLQTDFNSLSHNSSGSEAFIHFFIHTFNRESWKTLVMLLKIMSEASDGITDIV